MLTRIRRAFAQTGALIHAAVTFYFRLQSNVHAYKTRVRTDRGSDSCCSLMRSLVEDARSHSDPL